MTLTLRQTAEEALRLLYEIEVDDGPHEGCGEFCSVVPWEAPIAELAKANGFTFDQVMEEVHEMEHEPVPCPKCNQPVPEEHWFQCPHCGYGKVD